MRRKWVFGVTSATVVILELVLWWALRSTPSAPGILRTNGRIEGDQAAVGAKIGGKIVRLAVHEGERLEAGALIAQLASEQAQAQLAQAEHVYLCRYLCCYDTSLNSSFLSRNHIL